MIKNFLNSQLNTKIKEIKNNKELKKKLNNYEYKKQLLLSKNKNELVDKIIKKNEELGKYDELIDDMSIIRSKMLVVENFSKINEFEQTTKYDDCSDDMVNSCNSGNIKTLILTYQYSYNDDIKVTGLGDFIRGCYFLCQFSERHNYKFDFFINEHPIKNYLEYFVSKQDLNKAISSNIKFFKVINYNYTQNYGKISYDYINIDKSLLSHINKLNQLNEDKDKIFLYLINHPDESKIKEFHKQQIRHILKPVKYLNDIIEETLKKLLLSKKNYIVIHVRMDDDCFLNNYSSVTKKRFAFLINSINQIKQAFLNREFLLLASNNLIKQLIIKHIPSIKTLLFDIGHTCVQGIDDNKVINTLKEFYIMSYSSIIYSFSVYTHGSGFSKWCATTYNIPYSCYLIE